MYCTVSHTDTCGYQAIMLHRRDGRIVLLSAERDSEMASVALASNLTVKVNLVCRL